MRWTSDNLETHAAKHFLGDPAQQWGSLCDATRWNELRTKAREAACVFHAHPASCPAPHLCRPVQRTAADIYQQIVAASWDACQVEEFWVRTRDTGGKPLICTTGPHGVYILAVQDGQDTVAKTAYRPGAGSGWARTGVRKMRGYASQSSNGWTTCDLLWLEAALLRPDTIPNEERIARVRDRLLGLTREPGAGL